MDGEIYRETLETKIMQYREALKEYGEFTPSGVYEAGRVDGLKIALELLESINK